eukprot:TRINITY_DN21854_c0_g4_i1.p1 TRINITY_DN21854_c0_g4~~TRINITY_DN21854_c0_g4_i1.p1  ORF type:complete len:258 (-),score=29.43 TRINITY_DN21854_c0_g4_i1:138-911(-)
MAPRSPVVISYAGATIYINDMAYLREVLACVQDRSGSGCSSLCSSMQSAPPTLSTSGSARMLPSSPRTGSHIADSKPVLNDNFTDRDDCSVNDSSTSSDGAVKAAPLVEPGFESAEACTQTDTLTYGIDMCVGSDLLLLPLAKDVAASVDQCVGTCVPVFSQDEVLDLIDSKVAMLNDQCRFASEALSKCQADLVSVSQTRDEVVSKLAKFESMALRWADAASEVSEFPNDPRAQDHPEDISEFLTVSKKKKNGKNR